MKAFTIARAFGLFMIPSFASGSSWDYAERTGAQPFKTFPSVMTDSELVRLVNDSSKIEDGKRIAISTITESDSRNNGYFYPRRSASEIEFKWICDSIVKSELSTIPHSTWVKPLPTTLIPAGSGFDHYREAAARLHANILVLYKVDANIYENVKLFGKNTVMAISTIEFMAINISNGTVTASEVVSKKVKIKQEEDEPSESMMDRAKSLAILEAIKEGIRSIKPQL